MATISRSILFSKLNPGLLKSLENATAFCKLRGNPYVELSHWLHQLMQENAADLQHIFQHFGVNEGELRQDILHALERLPRGASSISDLSEHIDHAVERSWVYASLKFAATQIRGGDLMLGMLTTVNLCNQLTAISRQFSKINAETLQSQFQEILQNSSETRAQQELTNHAQAASADVDSSTAAPSSLQKYAIDLTEKSRNKTIDPVVGRDEEIRQMIDILMRRRQNNPLLTGEAGVGKTAVVEGLALRITRGEVPPALQQVQLYQLDLGMLQAGAGMKGEFEARLQSIIKEVQSSAHPIILFIDEIHTMVGAGGAAGTGDAANLLKPALARGQLRTIGATTWSEYKKYIEKDPALTRRFQVVQIFEPNEERALEMLRHSASTLEQHHQVLLLDEAMAAAVHLSHRYIPARQLPDKAVGLLDTACARVAVSQRTEPPQLEDCRRQIENLELGLKIVERETGMGITPLQCAAPLQQALDTLRNTFAALQTRWQKERALAQEIIALRGLLSTDAPACETTETIDTHDLQADRRRRLAELMAQFNSDQADNPLIFAAVDANTVAAVVSDWTGIPLGRMVKDEIDAVLNLTETLGQRVIGQADGLDLIARRIRSSYAKLGDPHKPVGVFLLCGPSGVGKTETALALADALYGGEQNVITINMSEFQEAHTVSTLKGAPPGYVGYGEGGVLTEAVRRRPYSVVLLDEIEKAHADVHEIFFQVFDKGWMEDGEGRHIDFRNTIIILTSNIGSETICTLCPPTQTWPSVDILSSQLRPQLRQTFPAALLGRLLVVPYYPLSDESLGSIVRLQLARIQQRLQDNHQITSRIDEALVQEIVNRCTEPESGGRMVDAILTNNLLPQLSYKLLTAAPTANQKNLYISMQDGNFTFQYVNNTIASHDQP